MIELHDMALDYPLSGIGTIRAPFVLAKLIPTPTAGHKKREAKIIPMIIDTGLTCTCIPDKYAKLIGHDVDYGRPVSTDRCMNEHERPRLHYTRIQISVHRPFDKLFKETDHLVPYVWTLKTCVCKSLKGYPRLAGKDFLKCWEFTLRTHNNSFSLVPRDSDLRRSLYNWGKLKKVAKY